MTVQHKTSNTDEHFGNLSKSAEAMHITQPAASHLLKNLEVQLGTNVYHRINKKLVLTKAGAIILKAALDILPDLEEYKTLIANVLSGKMGVIRIATECYTSYTWLPNVLQSFQKLYPNVEVEINVRATSNPKKHLADGKIDLAIAIDPELDKRFSYHELFKDEIKLVVSKLHKLSSKNHIDAQDLIDENSIMSAEKFENNSVAQKLLIPNKVQPKKITKLQLTDAILQMVHAGMGVASILSWMLKSYLKKEGLSAIRVSKKGLFRKWAILSLKNKNFDYLIEFIQHFQVNVSP